MFVAETASLLDLFPELSKEGTEVFKTSFPDFSVNCGIPIAAIPVSKQENCRMCKKTFVVTGQRVEKDSFKQIALKLISCYLQKIRLWDCLLYGNPQTS